jgi:hypothetical protein
MGRVDARIMAAKGIVRRNSWDAVWLTPAPRGDRINVILSANDRIQFEAAKNMFVPKPQPRTTRKFKTICDMVAAHDCQNGAPSSLSDLSTKQEQNGHLFHQSQTRRNMRTYLEPGLTYSSANLLSPTDC